MSDTSKVVFGRRGFLKGLSIAPLAFSPLVTASRAMANNGFKPRLVVIALAHGLGGRDCATGTETNFTFKPWLSPLNPIKKHVTLIDGLMGAWWGNAHSSSYAHLLTGNNDPNAKTKTGKYSSLPRNPSIDVLLEKALGQGVLPVQRLNVGKGTAVGSFYKSICYNENLKPLDMLGAVDTNNLLLKNLTNSNSNTAAQNLALKRKHILDELNKDIIALRGRISPAERNKLDQHLDAIKQSVVNLGLNGGVSTGNACVKPQPFTQSGSPHEFYLDQQLKHLKTIFSCNLTQLAVMWVPEGGASSGIATVPFPWKDSTGANRKGIIKCGKNSFHTCVAHYNGVPDMELCYKGSVQWFLGKIAKFAQELDQITEANGKTMLENTIIVLTGEVGSGQHEVIRKPYILIGGSGAPKMRTGRYIKPASRTLPHSGAKKTWTTPDGKYDYIGKTPVSSFSELDLLLELSEIMGVPGGLKNFGMSYMINTKAKIGLT